MFRMNLMKQRKLLHSTFNTYEKIMILFYSILHFQVTIVKIMFGGVANAFTPPLNLWSHVSLHTAHAHKVIHVAVLCVHAHHYFHLQFSSVTHSVKLSALTIDLALYLTWHFSVSRVPWFMTRSRPTTTQWLA
jgi:hypothetical protein